MLLLQSDLGALYIKAGVKNVGTVFLMTDAQVADEKFLVLLNDLLASGKFDQQHFSQLLKVSVTVKIFSLLCYCIKCKLLPKWRFCEAINIVFNPSEEKPCVCNMKCFSQFVASGR